MLRQCAINTINAAQQSLKDRIHAYKWWAQRQRDKKQKFCCFPFRSISISIRSSERISACSERIFTGKMGTNAVKTITIVK